MSERSPKQSGAIIHATPLSRELSGEANLHRIFETTGDQADWKVLGVGKRNTHSGLILPGCVEYEDLGPTPFNLPIPSDARAVLDAVGKHEPIIFTNNGGLRSLGLMAMLRSHGNRFFLWQTIIPSSNPDQAVKKPFGNTPTAASLHLVPGHIAFSPEDGLRLKDIGLTEERITVLPHVFNRAGDRNLRKKIEAFERGKDRGNDALRILVSSDISANNGTKNLPAFLEALDCQLMQLNKKMSVTLIGNIEDTCEARTLMGLLDMASLTLDNVRFKYAGNPSLPTTHGLMAKNDIALSVGEVQSSKLLEGFHMGLPNAVQKSSLLNSGLIESTHAGWVLTGDVQTDAAMIAQLRYDYPDILERREMGYRFVDDATGENRFRDVFLQTVFSG